jgi:ribose transport system substrate-binding protein
MFNALKSLACAGVMLFGGLTVAYANPDTKVALVPGGPHPYFAAWAQAGQDAKRDFNLGAADYKVPQQWQLSEQNNLLESLVTQGYNAFLIFPGDPVGTVSTAQELTDAGATVIALAGCLKDPSPAAFCLGTDTGHSAYLGTKELFKGLGGTKKRILHITGFLVDPNTQLRINAVNQAAKEEGGTVVQTIADIDAPGPAEEKINAYLAAHENDIDGIISTAWVPSVVAANALRRIGTKRIKMVAIDHDKAVLGAIKDGFLLGTMLQNPYGQGYVGAYAADKLRSGCKVKPDAPFKTNALTNRFIDSGTVFAGPQQVDSYVESMKAITKTLFTTFEQTYLVCAK